MPDIGIKTDVTSGPNSDGILAKTPSEVVIKQVEFAGDDLADGETISSVDDVTITRGDGEAIGGSDLALDSSSASGTKVQLTLSGGVLGEGYVILITVTTSESQTLQGKVRMTVRGA